MPIYSPEFKEQTVRKLMPPHNRTVASLSQEIGVSEATFYNWKKRTRSISPIIVNKRHFWNRFIGQQLIYCIAC